MTSQTLIGIGANCLVVVVLLAATAVRVLAAIRADRHTCLPEDDSRTGCLPPE